MPQSHGRSLNLTIGPNYRVDACCFTDWKEKQQEIIGRGSSGEYGIRECRIDMNGDVECMISSESLQESAVFNYINSLIKIGDINVFLINGDSVDIHEFKRTIFNAELSSKLTVPELEEIRKMGGEIIKTVDKIKKAHFITPDDYKKLIEVDKKRGGQLHL